MCLFVTSSGATPALPLPSPLPLFTPASGRPCIDQVTRVKKSRFSGRGGGWIVRTQVGVQACRKNSHARENAKERESHKNERKHGKRTGESTSSCQPGSRKVCTTRPLKNSMTIQPTPSHLQTQPHHTPNASSHTTAQTGAAPNESHSNTFTDLQQPSRAFTGLQGP